MVIELRWIKLLRKTKTKNHLTQNKRGKHPSFQPTRFLNKRIVETVLHDFLAQHFALHVHETKVKLRGGESSSLSYSTPLSAKYGSFVQSCSSLAIGSHYLRD